jgi:NAD(P)-dependent dehydrogenase (short-subunit alcohol dehydrogenase family)
VTAPGPAVAAPSRANFAWLDLSGKVCVVTGADGGLGRAISAGLAAAGGRVVLLDRHADALAAHQDALTREGGEAMVAACDVSDPASIMAAAKESESRFGSCHVLVNNAALLRPGPLETLALAEWNALIAVNLTGYLLCSQTFGQQMRQRAGGSIVHVASIAASHPQGFSGAYSVSKAGIVMLSRQIATEWGSAGIRSNVVSPGMVLTPMSQPFYDAPGVTERRSAVVPAGRIGAPDDIRDAVLFLASERSSYISGEEIGVNGGFAHMLMNLIPRPGFGGAAPTGRA